MPLSVIRGIIIVSIKIDLSEYHKINFPNHYTKGKKHFT